MVDRVVHDVVPSNGAKDTRPNVPVDLFVLVRAFWFELCERSGGLHYRGENPYAP